MTSEHTYHAAAVTAVVLGLIVIGLSHTATALPVQASLLGKTLGIVLLGGGAYARLSGKQGRVLMRMVLLVLLPISAIGVLLVFLAFHFMPDTLGNQPDKLAPALMAGIAVSLGWIASPLTQELRRSDEREERRQDMIEASAIEIWQIADFAAKLNVADAVASVKHAFARQTKYEVFVLHRREFGTLKRLVEQIEILERHQIEAVTSFYALLTRLDYMEERMESEQFRRLPRPRRENAVEIYYRILATIPAEALDVLKTLERAEYAADLERVVTRKQKEFAPSSTMEGDANA